LGLVQPTGVGFGIGVGIVIALTLILAASLRSARKTYASDEQKKSQCLGDLAVFMPSNDRELRNFYAVSVTAGIVEEILYRGYLLWLFGLFMPVWVAAVVSSAVFGLGHSYQGLNGGIRTGLVGLALALLYVGSGSIWLPIVAHAIFDILQGATVRELLRESHDRSDPVEASIQ